MTNLYVFWRLATDPPAPWTRLTRTNQYLRLDPWVANHWGQVGATTHIHPSISGLTVGTSVHSGAANANTGTSLDDIMGPHNDHPIIGSSIDTANSNNPLGFGLDIIYVDMGVWERSIRSFPLGSIIMSNGVLVDAQLERYSAADGRFIVHAEPETYIGSSAPQSHSVSGTLGQVYGLSYLTCSMRVTKVGDRSLQHGHTFSFASEAKYVEPRALITRLYRALQDTSSAVAGSVVFVDGNVSSMWEILTGWAGGNLKIGDSDPYLAGSDTHEQTLSGVTNTYDGPDAFDNEYSPNRTVYDSHYHPITGTLASVSHVPSSRLIVPARLLSTVYRSRKTAGPQVIGLW